MKGSEPMKSFLDLELEAKKSSKTHFLEKVDKMINWKPINDLLKRKYKRKRAANGALAYHPLMMFKILLLQVWYGLSDPGVEEALYDRLSFMRFTGLSISSSVPDHSTISRFRNALTQLGVYDTLLQLLNDQFKAHELIVKQGAAVDATVVQSSARPRRVVNVEAEDRKETDRDDDPPTGNGSGDSKDGLDIELSKDPDARWIKKGTRSYFGYKCHMAVDVKHGLILGGHVTPANLSDMNQLAPLLEESQIESGTIILGDKGYTSKKNKTHIRGLGCIDMLMAKKPKGKPMPASSKRMNRAISKIRYIVEQGFGTLKRCFGLDRMRYMGVEKSQTDFLLKVMGFNMLKVVRLVF